MALATALKRKYNSGADSVLMSDEDYAAVTKYGADWTAARDAGNQAGMQAAHDAAEALRAKYSYSGGSDGSEYIKLPQKSNTAAAAKPPATGGFTYESAPAYASRYQSQIDALTAEILGREDFSYDPETDPRYASYQKAYAREGQRAAADTMGQLAAMTGGMPSTAAVTASQQAGDYYAAQMADKIPELYELAYAMYQDDVANQRADLDMLAALEQGDYAKYLNELGQYNTDRSFAYGTWSDQWDRDYQLSRDALNDLRYDQEFNYSADRDALSDQRYNQEYADSKAMDRAQTLAQYGNFSGYGALGYSDEEIAAMESAWARDQAASQLVSRSGGSGGSSASGGGGMDYDGLFAAARADGYSPKSFIANNYKKYGFSSSSGLYDAYRKWAVQKNKNAIKEFGAANGMTGTSGAGTGGGGYEDLSDRGRMYLDAINQINSRSGGTGATESDLSKLEQAVERGELQEWEVDLILDLLGEGGR